MNQNHSLKGLKILNTRPKDQAAQLSEAIRKKGGQAIDCPLLELKKTNTTWLDTLPMLNEFHHAIFISPNAVTFFFDALKNTPYSFPKELKIHTIGQGSAKAIQHLGLDVATSPLISDSEHFLEQEIFKNIKAEKILIVKGEGGRPLLTNTLRQRGGLVHELPVYQRQACLIDRTLLKSLWQENDLDIIIFTSLEAMHSFYEQSDALHQRFCKKTCLVLSNRLASAARAIGYQRIIITAPDAILTTLEQFAQGRNHD